MVTFPFNRTLQTDVAKKRFGYVALLTLFVLGLCGGCSRADSDAAQNNSPSGKKHIVQRGEDVHFTLSGTYFTLPKKYVAGGAEQYGNLTDVKLRALLPEFEGYRPEVNGREFRYEFSRRPGWGGKLYVKLTVRGRSPAYPFTSVRRKNESVYSPLYGRDGIYDEMRFGLEYYANHADTHKSRNEFFVYRPNDTPLVLISCRPFNPNPGCELKWAYSQKLNGEMDFSMEYLPQWKSIWMKANSLFENGTTSGFDEAAWQERMTNAFSEDYYQWKATLPDFNPCQPGDCPGRFSKRDEPPGYDNRLYVRLRHRARNAKPMPEIWRELYQKRKHPFYSVSDEYDEMRYGLEFHRGKRMTYSFRDDTYMRRSELGPDVVISCYAEANKRIESRRDFVAEGCVGQWPLPSNAIVYAAFSREYLPRWREIMAWASKQAMAAQGHANKNSQGD